MTTALYEIETSETDDGNARLAECLWTPSGEDAADNGFIAYRGLYVAGIGARTTTGRTRTGSSSLASQRVEGVVSEDSGRGFIGLRPPGGRTFHPHSTLDSCSSSAACRACYGSCLKAAFPAGGA
ncbi:hypothetical protein SAV14893_084680 [Streptomyces avermitilis]|uniref:Uncharacterized protein n=1 Tax=Streptomyces avermitilis TaxID=33903 RepID=A0A4D4MB39_STRAX|nr:hypothetical protein SAV14893_084680 [Streptomyces avermitilis]GDY70545.1 hypothetical protein SAV31267_000300 [Streptomyces avermitilis]